MPVSGCRGYIGAVNSMGVMFRGGECNCSHRVLWVQLWCESTSLPKLSLSLLPSQCYCSFSSTSIFFYSTCQQRTLGNFEYRKVLCYKCSEWVVCPTELSGCAGDDQVNSRCFAGSGQTPNLANLAFRNWRILSCICWRTYLKWPACTSTASLGHLATCTSLPIDVH